MLLTFSGMDGAGKSTQIGRLAQQFERQGRTVVCIWARGGYTPGFEWLKRILRRLAGKRLPPPGASRARETTLANPWVARVWLALAIIDLMFYWGIYVRYQGLRGRIVICDRYLNDTRLDFRLNFPHIHIERSVLWRLLSWVTPVPDASFVLWLPVPDSMQRCRLKNEPFPDDEQALASRSAAYCNELLFPVERYIKLDGREPIDVISEKIVSHISKVSSELRSDNAA